MLRFSQHARERLAERGLTLEEINRWTEGALVLCFTQDAEQHFVGFFPALREFGLLVLDGEKVITFMPLIWREGVVAPELKIRAYEIAMGMPSGGASLGGKRIPANPTLPSWRVTAQIEVSSGQFCMVRLGKWPGNVGLDEVARNIAAQIEAGLPVRSLAGSLSWQQIRGGFSSIEIFRPPIHLPRTIE